MKEAIDNRDVKTWQAFEEYRKNVSEADSSQIDEVVKRVFPEYKPTAPVVTEVQVFGNLLDKVYGRQPKDHHELYPDTCITDDRGLRKAISKVVDPCYTFGFCRIPRSWWKDLKQSFWKLYFNKFPKKKAINRHNYRVREASRLLAGMGDKTNNTITQFMGKQC